MTSITAISAPLTHVARGLMEYNILGKKLAGVHFDWLILDLLSLQSPEQFMKTVIGIKSNEDFFDNYVRQNGSRINITRLRKYGRHIVLLPVLIYSQKGTLVWQK